MSLQTNWKRASLPKASEPPLDKVTSSLESASSRCPDFNECHFCFHRFVTAHGIIHTLCNHRFHASCIDVYFADRKINPQFECICPYCSCNLRQVKQSVEPKPKITYASLNLAPISLPSQRTLDDCWRKDDNKKKREMWRLEQERRQQLEQEEARRKEQESQNRIEQIRRLQERERQERAKRKDEADISRYLNGLPQNTFHSLSNLPFDHFRLTRPPTPKPRERDFDKMYMMHADDADLNGGGGGGGSGSGGGDNEDDALTEEELRWIHETTPVSDPLSSAAFAPRPSFPVNVKKSRFYS